MESKVLIVILLVNLIYFNKLVKAYYVQISRDVRNPAFDPSFYKDALDPELCKRHIAIGRSNCLLWMKFVESGLRVPRGILTGNIVDLGNYYQCLGIHQELEDTVIEGKFCTINVPINQRLDLPEWPSLPDIPGGIEWPEWPGWPELPELPEWIDFNPNNLIIRNETVKQLQMFDAMNAGVRSSIGTRGNGMRSTVDGLVDIQFTLAVCIPKTCTTREGVDGLVFDSTALGFQYEDRACRLPNDKPWAPGVYVAIVIFSFIGLLTLLSTGYDIYYTIILKTDSKSVSIIRQSFSLYTNTRRLTTFVSNPGALECIDGIRAMAMVWVIVGHTFYTLPFISNSLDALDWQTSFRSFWITAAPITVDTFFMLSGLLLVYTTSGKMTGNALLKKLHLFYLNRILRMLPLLGAAVLLQASLFHHMSDGPVWETVALNTNNCRLNWWATMLYIQNFVSPENLCLGHTWYLAIDMQLHILSPLVLFWVLSSNKRVAWIALAAALLIWLTAATTYNFIMEFPGGVIVPARAEESIYYATGYYFNTLARATPFFVGMIFGYVLHLFREEKLELPKIVVTLLWCGALTLTTAALLSPEPMKDVNWDNQTVDSFVNSFMRSAWATGLGWIIVACVHGYGGPVNWFLSLRLWKLPSRISYAMYLFHFPIMYVIYGSSLVPVYFSVISSLYEFLSQFAISFIVGFVMTLIIDSPFSTIFKVLLGGGVKRRQPEKNKEKANEFRSYKL